MLHEFLSSHREELISRCRAKVATRHPPATARELQHGVPVFLTQLVQILRAEGLDPGVSGKTTEAAVGLDKTATHHGNELSQEGFTLDQVVHGYGDVCQSVTELAVETNATITNTEFQTLNRCLDVAIARAVSEYSRDRDQTDKRVDKMNRSRDLVDDQLMLIKMAIAAMDAIRSGKVGMGGATGGVLERTLRGLQDLTAAALTDVPVKASTAEQH